MQINSIQFKCLLKAEQDFLSSLPWKCCLPENCRTETNIFPSRLGKIYCSGFLLPQNFYLFLPWFVLRAISVAVFVVYDQVLTKFWRKWLIPYRFKALIPWPTIIILLKSFALFLCRGVSTSEPNRMWKKEWFWHSQSIKQNSIVLDIAPPLAEWEVSRWQLQQSVCSCPWLPGQPF